VRAFRLCSVWYSLAGTAQLEESRKKRRPGSISASRFLFCHNQGRLLDGVDPGVCRKCAKSPGRRHAPMLIHTTTFLPLGSLVCGILKKLDRGSWRNFGLGAVSSHGDFQLAGHALVWLACICGCIIFRVRQSEVAVGASSRVQNQHNLVSRLA